MVTGCSFTPKLLFLAHICDHAQVNDPAALVDGAAARLRLGRQVGSEAESAVRRGAGQLRSEPAAAAVHGCGGPGGDGSIQRRTAHPALSGRWVGHQQARLSNGDFRCRCQQNVRFAHASCFLLFLSVFGNLKQFHQYNCTRGLCCVCVAFMGSVEIIFLFDFFRQNAIFTFEITVRYGLSLCRQAPRRARG